MCLLEKWTCLMWSIFHNFFERDSFESWHLQWSGFAFVYTFKPQNCLRCCFFHVLSSGVIGTWSAIGKNTLWPLRMKYRLSCYSSYHLHISVGDIPDKGVGNAPGRDFSGGRHFCWKEETANGLSRMNLKLGGGTFRLAPGWHFSMSGPWV